MGVARPQAATQRQEGEDLFDDPASGLRSAPRDLPGPDLGRRDRQARDLDVRRVEARLEKDGPAHRAGPEHEPLTQPGVFAGAQRLPPRSESGGPEGKGSADLDVSLPAAARGQAARSTPASEGGD